MPDPMSNWPLSPNAHIGVVLGSYGQRLREKCGANPGLSVQDDPDVFCCYLAFIFETYVGGGGFSQLFAYLSGNYMAEMESVLLSLGARNAHQAYVKAVKMCVPRVAEYTAFLKNESEGDQLKDDLTLLSLDYLRSEPSFLVEAEAELRKLRPRVDYWLMLPH